MCAESSILDNTTFVGKVIKNGTQQKQEKVKKVLCVWTLMRHYISGQ